VEKTNGKKSNDEFVRFRTRSRNKFVKFWYAWVDGDCNAFNVAIDIFGTAKRAFNRKYAEIKTFVNQLKYFIWRKSFTVWT
jgi:hypothetical protein